MAAWRGVAQRRPRSGNSATGELLEAHPNACAPTRSRPRRDSRATAPDDEPGACSELAEVDGVPNEAVRTSVTSPRASGSTPKHRPSASTAKRSQTHDATAITSPVRTRPSRPTPRAGGGGRLPPRRPRRPRRRPVARRRPGRVAGEDEDAEREHDRQLQRRVERDRQPVRRPERGRLCPRADGLFPVAAARRTNTEVTRRRLFISPPRTPA